MLSQCVIDSPIGHIAVTAIDDQLSKIDFVDDKIALITPKTTYLSTIVDQLQNYFIDASFKFKLAYDVVGTSFQCRVWKALCQIKSGETFTYGEFAKALATGPRAIGQACRTNPLPIIVPCHRIVAANHIGGFAGNIQGRFAAIKTWLLQHEKHIQQPA